MPVTKQPSQVNTDEPRIGVMVANLGTPEGTGYWAIRRYLSEFLSDPLVIKTSPWIWQPILQGIILTKRPFATGKAYRSIWNNEADESPLMTITRDQKNAIADALGDKFDVDFCMRYGSPSTKSRVDAMIARGCEKIIFFPLYPQFAGATTETANRAFMRAIEANPRSVEAKLVPEYYNNPDYIDALAESVERVYADLDYVPDVLVTSYHGMPESYRDAGDPYYGQCIKTSELLCDRLGWAKDTVVSTFQSRFGPMDWIKPYTVDEVARLAKAGKKRIAVISPAFSADCIETLEEINFEIRDSFIEAGGESFIYIPCLNSEAAHIDVLANLIREKSIG